jgi:hypothetical protein
MIVEGVNTIAGKMTGNFEDADLRWHDVLQDGERAW